MFSPSFARLVVGKSCRKSAVPQTCLFTQDEQGVAAYKTVELDDHLGGGPVQYREVKRSYSDQQSVLSVFRINLFVFNETLKVSVTKAVSTQVVCV